MNDSYVFVVSVDLTKVSWDDVSAALSMIKGVEQIAYVDTSNEEDIKKVLKQFS